MLQHLLVLAFCFSGISSAFSAGDRQSLECRKTPGFITTIESPDYRKYAPDREVQMKHLALDVFPDFTNRTIRADVVLTFAPVSKPVTEVKLDAIDLSIDDVSSSEKLAGHEVTREKIVVTFAAPVAAGKEVTVAVKYHAEPKSGLYFRTPEMGYPAGDTHLWSQGEAVEARHWYPSLDSPNQRFTSEVTCHVPEGMTAISNGKLVSETKDATTGLVAIHWSQEKPHANYLISLTAGYLKRIEDRYKELPIAFYTPASEIAYASNSFRDTKDMLGFYEEEIGVPYPWAKYYQVCVQDFTMGGMENTSCTTLTDYTLLTDATETIRTSEGLVAHELAHQWFGDFVTCKDWSHIWLNESFATYYQSLYNAHKNGRESMLYEMYGRARQITGITNNFNSIVRRTYETEQEMFDYLAYPKGSWVLHMLRAQLGHELYRRCIRTYLERHRLGNVVTEDLRRVIEELSGRNFDQFFDQWLYHGYHPELELKYSWDEGAKMAKLTVRQTQKVSEQVLLFNFPVTIRFEGPFGKVDRKVEVKQKEEDFYFSVPAAPKTVRFDPEYTLLAKVEFKLPKPMLYAQLTNQVDMIGRLLALEQLAEIRDAETAAKLGQLLTTDAFYGARAEAARALRVMHTDAALTELLAATNQSDARVRRAVVAAIGDFYNERSVRALQAGLQTERNPEIAIAALKGLAGYSDPLVQSILLAYLNTNSFRNELAEASVSVMRSASDSAFLEPLMTHLQRHGTNFTSRGLSAALEAVAVLGRDQENKSATRQFINAYVDDSRERVRVSALNALGTLGDSGALSVLDRFAGATQDTAERKAAERAITTLREGRKQSDELKTLREEVLDLKKASRESKATLDELNKKFKAEASSRNAEPAGKSKLKREKLSSPKKAE